ncbi:tyrosine phosphatase-like protein [Fimicolochytrium jonesii]|uniref:tyrosine phosphatase-like protein n=1 Tax=Fimicolochytrium jonesii TaxID=1396493 RepID=UPI0022FDDAAB|nr:tyrosine phosphatase-like protein [Fimicolochytrium jonesii]KAI8826057.1 tyrosine phosphatase-like protein [Fimicolochytrium jonesii]
MHIRCETADALNFPLAALTTPYLVLYNLASTGAWMYLLWKLVAQIVADNGHHESVYGATGEKLTIVQTLALLEVAHAALGLVKAPVTTSAIQIITRLLIVRGVLNFVGLPLLREHWAVSTMISAWAIADIVRYIYYVFNMVGSVPGILQWARYTLFFVLYPIGAGSEWILLIKSLPYVKAIDERIYYAYIVVACLYPPGLYTMYTYMMAQRRKYIGGTDWVDRSKKSR